MLARTLRILSLAALVTLVAWSATLPAWTQDAEKPNKSGVDRSSPRALFNSFFSSWNSAFKRMSPKEREREPGRFEGYVDGALECLDLAGVAGDDPDAQRDEAVRLARQLKLALDFGGQIELDALPGPNHRGATYVHAVQRERIVTLQRDGAWVFSGASLAEIDAIVARLEASGAERYELRTLRRYVPEGLLGRALFLEHWQWLGLACLMILCWITNRIVVFTARQTVTRMLERARVLRAAAKVADATGKPFGLLAMGVLLWFGHPFLDLPEKPFLIAFKLLASVAAILLLFRAIDVVAARMLEAAEQTESKLDDQLVPLLRKSLKMLVGIGGALFILDNLEVDIMALLAGFGVAGLAISFAAQDTVANLFGSITVFLDRPFHVGDWVVVGSTEGTVEEVGFRTTRVRTFYNSLVSVPNSKLVTSVVDNMGAREFRRFKTVLGVQYDTPPERIEAFVQGIREVVLANPWMRHEVMEVHLNGFGPSSLDILVYVFFKVPGWSDELRQRQNFIVEILRLARELGVEFAFPTQTLHLASSPEHPLAEAVPKTEEELWEIAKSFGKDGARARPDGTARFAVPGSAPAEPQDS